MPPCLYCLCPSESLIYSLIPLNSLLYFTKNLLLSVQGLSSPYLGNLSCPTPLLPYSHSAPSLVLPSTNSVTSSMPEVHAIDLIRPGIRGLAHEMGRTETRIVQILAALQGHFQSTWMVAPLPTEKNSSKCIICHQPGHWTKEWPNKGKPPKSACYKC